MVSMVWLRYPFDMKNPSGHSNVLSIVVTPAIVMGYGSSWDCNNFKSLNNNFHQAIDLLPSRCSSSAITYA